LVGSRIDAVVGASVVVVVDVLVDVDVDGTSVVVVVVVDVVVVTGTLPLTSKETGRYCKIASSWSSNLIV
jgi:hypothetical protein